MSREKLALVLSIAIRVTRVITSRARTCDKCPDTLQINKRLYFACMERESNESKERGNVETRSIKLLFSALNSGTKERYYPLPADASSRDIDIISVLVSPSERDNSVSSLFKKLTAFAPHRGTFI